MRFLIQNTNSCNNQCKICYAGFGDSVMPPFDYMGMGLYAEFINKLKQSPIEQKIIIFGGNCEPTMDPTIKDKVKLAQDEGFEVHINSNGKLVKRLFDEGVHPNLWTISILGGLGTINNYEDITGLKLDDTLNLIDYLNDNNSAINISLTVDINDLSIIDLLYERFKNKRVFITIGLFDYDLSIDQIALIQSKCNREGLHIDFSDCIDSLIKNLVSCRTVDFLDIDMLLNVRFCVFNEDAQYKVGDLKTEELQTIIDRINQMRNDILVTIGTATCENCAITFKNKYVQ